MLALRKSRVWSNQLTSPNLSRRCGHRLNRERAVGIDPKAFSHTRHGRPNKNKATTFAANEWMPGENHG
jgi:hypothetical protein